MKPTAYIMNPHSQDARAMLVLQGILSEKGSELGSWTFWIDCGGTFTDIIAQDAQDTPVVHKLLSQSPHYESAVVQGIQEVLGHSRFSEAVKEIRLGTTIATNAFLERKGVPCALLTNLGHRDVLEIRQQDRPSLFDLNIKKISPLYALVAEVKGRMNSHGAVIEPLDLDIARFELERIRERGVRSVAISLMHSTVNPEHELALEQLARSLEFTYISLSHRVSPVAKFIARTETAVIDAYLSPYLAQYTQGLEEALGIKNILYMKSDGGLCQASELKGYNALLSGPAGGLIGAIEVAKKRGHDKVITFDMGGTSTDVAIYDGELNVDTQPKFHGIKLLAPMVDIHTVAAGGGSVLKYDQGRFVVGPESAGAFPGPACYRNGGPLTVTDANLFLGRIEPEKFPKVFGKDRNQGLDKELVRERFGQLAHEINMTAEQVAEGFLDVAVETMARAVRKISIERGYDPSDFTMVSFGGAGGQLAARVAETLQMERILIHPLASVLSAYGIGFAAQSLTLRAKSSEGFSALEEKLKNKFVGSNYKTSRFYMLNAKGSDHEVQILAESLAEAKRSFKAHYESVFGVTPTEEVECSAIALKGEVQTKPTVEMPPVQEEQRPGPSVISENNTSVIVESNWKAKRDAQGLWTLLRVQEKAKKTQRDPRIELEIFYQRFQFIAEQMGFTLQKLAQSVNIKERNDFSCALFNKEGELLANAPHIPVHLGSMGDAVKAVIDQHKAHPGDSYICNDPHFGGTHLPDITVITPVFCGEDLVMWVASRGHHADVGGKSPGSMPGDSRTLLEEGVVISPQPFVAQGRLDLNLLKEIFTHNKYPARNFEVNVHDIKAKLAANKKGQNELVQLFSQAGLEHTLGMAEAIMAYSDKKIRSVLSDLTHNWASKEIADGRSLSVAVRKVNSEVEFDFSGTSGANGGNFNTPVPVVKATVLFVLRSMIQEGIPLNDGIMRAVRLKIPKGCLLNPPRGAAVVAGNVETSQALCDLLFSALNLKANSQGTMNNLSFGNETHQYYETIGGGSGATETSEGASAVQVNMTNSLLTDPEILETRYPVVLELMGVRRGSGGLGGQRGGDGIYRRLRFLEPMEVSVLSQSRHLAPLGIKGGESGLRGRNLIENSAGLLEQEECFQVSLQKGDRLSIETPGGGGFGTVLDSPKNLVFAFGSNLDLRQIKDRCPSAQLITRAQVGDVELRYTKYSVARQGGVADMYGAAGQYVVGLLYAMNDDDLQTLDEIECGGGYYKRIQIQAVDDNGRVWPAFAYDIIDKEPDVEPDKTYAWLVYSGAYSLNAPVHYLKRIML